MRIVDVQLVSSGNCIANMAMVKIRNPPILPYHRGENDCQIMAKGGKEKKNPRLTFNVDITNILRINQSQSYRF